MFCIPGGREGVCRSSVDLFLYLFLGLGGGAKPQKPCEWRPVPLTLCQALAPTSQGCSLHGAGLGEGFPDSQALLTLAPRKLSGGWAQKSGRGQHRWEPIPAHSSLCLPSPHRPCPSKWWPGTR